MCVSLNAAVCFKEFLFCLAAGGHDQPVVHLG